VGEILFEKLIDARRRYYGCRSPVVDAQPQSLRPGRETCGRKGENNDNECE